MKPTWISLCLLLTASFAAVPASAQTYRAHSKAKAVDMDMESTYHPSGDNRLGFEFGPGVANMNESVPQGRVAPNTDTRTRPMMGMFYEHDFIPYLAIRPELNYVQRGFGVSQGQGADAASSEYAANYLELPVMAKGQYTFGVVTPYVVTGPFVGMLVGKGETDTQGGQSNEVSLDNVVNTFNFGWNFGAGTSFAVSRMVSLEASCRYSMGLTNVLTNPNPGFSMKLNSIQVLGGMSVNL